MASSSAPSSGPSTHCTNTSSTRFTAVLWRTLASLCNLACGLEASTIHKKEFTGDVHTQALPHVTFAFTLGFFFFHFDSILHWMEPGWAAVLCLKAAVHAQEYSVHLFHQVGPFCSVEQDHLPCPFWSFPTLHVFIFSLSCCCFCSIYCFLLWAKCCKTPAGAGCPSSNKSDWRVDPVPAVSFEETWIQQLPILEVVQPPQLQNWIQLAQES